MALYPPVVASSMPAFDIAQSNVKIYFTLSQYNLSRIEDIVKVHVTIRYQSSNKNALLAQTEIFQTDLKTDQNLNRYYVQIPKNVVQDNFRVDTLYKVQLRFCSILRDPSISLSNFYTNYVEYFSEWSTVCIIKPINVPLFYVNDFYVEDDELGRTEEDGDENNFFSSLADFVCTYKQNYQDENGTNYESSQTLKKWRLKLFDEDFNLLADSGDNLVSANNYTLDSSSLSLHCSLPYELENSKVYNLTFYITTKNDYSSSVNYSFTCTVAEIDGLNGILQTYINEEEGYIKVVYTDNSDNYTGNLVLRRSDSKSNFLKWEDLKNFEAYGDTNFTYYDFTAESGLLYRYLIQKRNSRGRRGTPTYDQTYSEQSGTMAEWTHAFLLESTGNGAISGTKQLKLKFDFQISSYKTNISESRTDTLGSKYPYIRRNGEMYYRSFPVTGTITQYMDDANLFTNTTQLFNGYFDEYKEFKGQIGNYVTQYDYTYERKFREKVQQFLYNVKPKLYKSMQEGNIFIKLMEVSLTPKNELGRLIYTFSATAYQIEEANIDTFNNYGLITVGQYNPNVYTTVEVLSQLNGYSANEKEGQKLFEAGKDIIGTGSAPAARSVASHVKYQKSFNGSIITQMKLNWIRLQLNSDPYLIIEQDGIYRPFVDKAVVSEQGATINTLDDVDNPIDYQLYQMQSTYNGTNVYLGHLFTINGQQVIVSPPNNIYEIDNPQANIISIIPAKETALSISYRGLLKKEADTSKDPKNIRVDRVNGQLMGSFDEKDKIVQQIRYKYNYSYEQGKYKVKKYVNNINSILLDTDPGAIAKVSIKSSQDLNPLESRFVVNHTGELNFDPGTGAYINSFRLVGKNFNLNKDISQYPIVSSLDQIRSPRIGDVCKIGSQYYYYLPSSWYPATYVSSEKSMDVNCPVEGMIFYCADVRRDYF